MHHYYRRTLPSMFPDFIPAEASAGAAPPASRATTPALFSRGERAERRFWEFFTAHIRNPNTRLAYLAAVRRFATAAGIGEDRRGPLFRSCEPGRRDALQDRAMSRLSALKMIKRRARLAGLPAEICAHSFRGTGITEYLRNGGDLEVAARIAGHESTRTTQLYNRLNDEISLDEIERIHI